MSVIYFMQPTDGGPVKIGFTDDLERRHWELERHYGKPLTVLAVVEGGPDEERTIHERFAHLRLGGPGRGRRVEQFLPSCDLMEFIGRPLLVSANPHAMPVAAGPKTKPVRLDLSLELHQILRVVAAEQGKPMAVFAREVIEETVRRLYGERKGR